MLKQFVYIFRTYRKSLIIIILLMIFYVFSLPKKLFKDPVSTVITSENNELLGALIAKDGQWRFPENHKISNKFKTCITLFEDEYFYQHFGFNPVSILKAFWHNTQSNKTIRGGSTITQQLIRLYRKGKERTYSEKIKELILATRLEIGASKNKILSLYASHAPFGGNVVGLDAAAWRYFGRSSINLSWAETATLAVLPNAPSLIYPGKNQQKLKLKRNRLLKKLFIKKHIDSLTYQLALLEKIPKKPYALPQIAPHLLQRIKKEQGDKRVKTTLQKKLQEQVNSIVSKHYKQLIKNEIHNIAVLVLDVKTKKVIAYVGNSPTDNEHHKDVDVVSKPRSTGSILKPFLYAAMLDNGTILPNTLVADVPTQFGNYSPENFNKKYEGAISAKLALSKSLNVPAVRMLKDFGVPKFHHYLKALQLKDVKFNADHYGLSLILGGAESSLWDLCKSYANLSSTLTRYNESGGFYFSNDFFEPGYLKDQSFDFGNKSKEKTLFDAASIFATLESLKDVTRPLEDQNWAFFEASNKIAWKTGTSFGYRDAWAVGTTKEHVVGVWVGNADGEGRPGLVGVEVAAPILFDVFGKLPQSAWFNMPIDEMEEVEICNKSGYRATQLCTEKKYQFIPKSGLKTAPCPFHILVHVDVTSQYQVNSSCESIDAIKQKSWFVLPTLMEYYYKKKNPFYQSLPSFRADCYGENKNYMEFLLPNDSNQYLLPRDFDGKQNDLIIKVTHSDTSTTLFWYLDSTFIGATKDIHEMGIQPFVGNHLITVTDVFGNEIKQKITILE